MTPSPTVPFRPLLARTVLSAFVLAAALAAGPAAAAGVAKGNSARATQDSGYALVQLDGEPLATYARTAPPKGKKVDFSSTTVKAYRALLSKQRNDYKAWLRANAPQARVTGEFDISLNAVAVQAQRRDAGPGVGDVDGEAGAVPGALLPECGRPRPGADQRRAGLGAQWRHAGHGGRRREGGHRRLGHRPRPTRASPTPVTRAQTTSCGDQRFTNNKVIAAKVFNNKLPQNGFTAAAVDSHGTHVAGTVACNYQTPATVNGVDDPLRHLGRRTARAARQLQRLPRQRRERAIRGHPERARGRLWRRLRRRQHEPRRRQQWHPGSVDGGRRQPRHGQHGGRRSPTAMRVRDISPSDRLAWPSAG